MAAGSKLKRDDWKRLAANFGISVGYLSHARALLDGRNRLAACKIAGVEPEFVSVNGADPVALSVSLNVKRRNLTKSQTAIAAAQVWDGANFGPGKRADHLAEMFGTSAGYIKNARALLDRAPDLADAVKAGTMPLADAYEELRGRERAHQKRDQVLTELRGTAPDLADAAEEGRLTLNEAIAASDERERKRREDVEIATANVTRQVFIT